jgi:hypothetical protein
MCELVIQTAINNGDYKKLYNCVVCDKTVQFENEDNSFPEYEVDEKGHKYCYKCYLTVALSYKIL